MFLSLFLCVVLSNASPVICWSVLTTTVSTLSVPAVYLLEVCFLEAKPLFAECVALATLVVGITYMNYMEVEVEQAGQSATVAAVTDVVDRLGHKEGATQKGDRDDEVAPFSQVSSSAIAFARRSAGKRRACSARGFENVGSGTGELKCHRFRKTQRWKETCVFSTRIWLF